MTKKTLKRKLSLLNGMNNYYSVGKCVTNKNMFKYMNMEAALLSLEKGIIRFNEPNVWKDSFESRFYTADYKNFTYCPATATPKLYACCFTNKKVSEAAWNIYNSAEKGLGAKCVQFVINVDSFRKELIASIKSPDNIYEGKIDYSLGDSVISKLHTSSSCYHNDIHKNFGFELYLSLMLLKRSSFSHEEEYRLFIKKEGDDNKGKSFYDVPINWVNVIDGIYLAEDFSYMEEKIFKDVCLSKGIKANLISKQPIYGKSSGKQIVFSK